MKKLFVLMAALAILATGCNGGGSGSKEHTVTFDCNYSSERGPVTSVVKVKDGETVSKPTVVRSDYDLDGWFKDNNTFKVAFDFTEKIKADLTLYAKWTAKVDPKVNATEWAAATSEAALRNVRIDLNVTMGGATYMTGFNEQDDNKCYAKVTSQGTEEEAYMEKVDTTYYKYEKSKEGAWVKNADTSGAVLPSEQYSVSFATLTFKESAFNTEEGAYVFEDQYQTLKAYFNNKKLVKFTVDMMGGLMYQECTLSKYGEMKVTLPEVK